MKKYKYDVEKLSKDALRYINIEIIIFIILYLVSIILLKDIYRVMAVAVITLFAVVDLLHDINYYKRLKKNNDQLIEAMDSWYAKKIKKFMSDVISHNITFAESSVRNPNKGIITIFMNRYAKRQNELYTKIANQKPTD